MALVAPAAGDVLHGGYALALAAGRSRPAALEFAVTAATRRVTSLGPFGWRTALRDLSPADGED